MSKNEPFAEDAYGILKPMKGGKKARGFTILETLIVLAVTGGLFVAIALTLSGRQQRTQFTQAAQEVQSQIQQVINDVSSGFYPSLNNFTCTASLTGPSLSAGAAAQGTNGGCVFLGKALQFGAGSSDPEQFNIFSIAGLQRLPTGEEVSSYIEAKPKAVSPPGSPDVTETKKLLYGLTTLRATYGASNTPIGTVAFVNSVASYSSGSIVSGSQQVRVIPIDSSALGQTQAQAATAINSQIAASPIDPAEGVKICFVSGGTDQSGLVTIGSNGRQLSVTLSIKENKTCA